MIGHIGIQNLEVTCIIGAHEEERNAHQTILVDVDCSYDFTEAIKQDSIAEVVNYSRIASMVEEHLVWQQYRLLESASAGIIEMLKQAYPDDIHSIDVSIRKPRKTKIYYTALSWKK